MSMQHCFDEKEREMKIVFALFILLLMPSLVWAQQIPTQCVTTVAAGGTGDAIQLPQLPCWPTTTMVVLQINAPNLTSTPTISVNGSTPIRVVNFDGTPLTPDVFLPGQYRILTYNGSNWLVMTAGAENGLPYTGTVVYNGPLDGVTPADYSDGRRDRIGSAWRNVSDASRPTAG